MPEDLRVKVREFGRIIAENLEMTPEGTVAVTAENLQLARAVAGYINSIRSGGADIDVWLARLPESLRDSAREVGNTLADYVLGPVGAGIGEATASADGLNVVLGDISGNLNVVANGGLAVARAFGQSFNRLGNATTSIASGLGQIATGVPTAASALQTLNRAFADITELYEDQIRPVETLEQRLTNVFANTAANIASSLREGMASGTPQMIAIANRTADQISSAFDPARSKLAETMRTLGNTILDDSFLGATTGNAQAQSLAALQKLLSSPAFVRPALASVGSRVTPTTNPLGLATQINYFTIEPKRVSELVEVVDFMGMLPIEQEIALRSVGAR
jgi:hypothetical protein